MLQLHFTFSPVQEYVSEARKTVDLWSGSYMLSYLAAAAAAGAIGAGAPPSDFFPAITDNPMLGAVLSSQRGPQHGSLPNRFSVHVPDYLTGQAWGRAAAARLTSTWQQAADRAGGWLIQQHPSIGSARGIWDRQTAAVWAINWVVAPDGGPLAGRKRFRVFEQTDEAGGKCTSCGHRQVLTAGDERAFWRGIREGRLGERFIIGAKDRLCAVCLFKRVLSQPGVSPTSWSVPGTFSSTPDLAADPWKRSILAREDAQAALAAFEREAGVPLSRLEGGTLYPGYAREIGEAESAALQNSVTKLYRRLGSRPRTHYAVLSMDGDRMGARLAELDPDQRQEMSRRILAFSTDVQPIVQNATAARLVYAGGEDVLALLPMDTAMETALRLRQRYTELFSDLAASLNREFTISAGLLFCPMHLPLRTAVRESHRLEQVAKEGVGRNALVVSVWGGGGPVLSVARKWDESDWVRQLVNLASQPLEFPTTWLYQSISMLRSLGLDAAHPAVPLDRNAVARLMAVEYYGSRDRKFHVTDIDDAVEKIAPLVRLAQPTSESGGWDPDILRLIRFFFEEEPYD